MENSLEDLEDEVEGIFQKVEKKYKEMKNRRENIGKLEDHSRMSNMWTIGIPKKGGEKNVCVCVAGWGRGGIIQQIIKENL